MNYWDVGAKKLNPDDGLRVLDCYDNEQSLYEFLIKAWK